MLTAVGYIVVIAALTTVSHQFNLLPGVDIASQILKMTNQDCLRHNQLADFSWYNGEFPWLQDRTIFLTKHGSRAYGTDFLASDDPASDLPISDLDVKGLAIPPAECLYGFVEKFEQHIANDPIDVVIFDIRKFVMLAVDCNPNIVEILFTDESDWILSTGQWRRLHSARDHFLSQRARESFVHYAMSQLHKIHTHRGYLLNPPKKPPERSDFSLPPKSIFKKEQLGIINSEVQKLADQLGGEGWTKDKVIEHDAALVQLVVESLDVGKRLMPMIVAERAFKAAIRTWDAYKHWKLKRNPARAALEERFGYDTKHAGHLVRLMRMASEILSNGHVLVKRPDAVELKAIRCGAWKYEELVKWAEFERAKIDAIKSTLPLEPPTAMLNQLLVGIVSDYMQ